MAIDRQCLADQIRKSLIQRIVSGELKPGERLIELALAKEFATSQTPVREALQSLEAIRMVESLPHRGVRVREVTEHEMAEAYQVRGLLEEFAANSAAKKISTETMENLLTIAKKIEEAADSSNSAAYAESDLQFHREIMNASGNGTLLRMWDSLAFEYRTPMMMQRHPPNLEGAAADHFQVIRALQEGDGQLAGRLLREHAESFIPAHDPPHNKR